MRGKIIRERGREREKDREKEIELEGETEVKSLSGCNPSQTNTQRKKNMKC